jgi:hypothetical protein
MLSGQCHCGQVKVTLKMAPDYVNECNCSLCGSHGVLWGYFAPEEVQIVGDTCTYSRADVEQSAVNLHFCGTCGCTTHWTPTDIFVARTGAADRMGANMRLFPPAHLTGIEIRFPDGRNWDGLGQWGFVKPAERMP